MKLDRQELLKAIAFLKPAIMVSDQPKPFNYVHVKTMGERCQLTTADGYCGKRATLFEPQQLSFDEKEVRVNQEFMIDKPILEAYEKLLSKHKTAFEKAARTDHTLRYVDISDSALESHKDSLSYNQPLVSYPDIEKYFVEGNFSLSDLRFDSELVIATLKEFKGVVYVSFEEHEKHSGIPQRVFMQTERGEYQAFFCPAVPREALNEKS